MTLKWFRRRSEKQALPKGLPLIHVLEGFLSAGHVADLTTAALLEHEVGTVHEFDVDWLLDHRARRPAIRFERDHYRDYERPRLRISHHRDLDDREYLVLSGPEPDVGWEAFVSEAIGVIAKLEVPLVLGLGGVPMGVPHTRPAVLTAHGNRPELVDRPNVWEAEIQIPSSIQSLLELRLGENGIDAAGYVIHVPHYLAQIEYPSAAIALLEAAGVRLGLNFDNENLRAAEIETNAQIESQIAEQGGHEVLRGLEQQYDAFHRGAAASLLADERLPSGEELADQLERFLAQQHDDGTNS